MTNEWEGRHPPPPPAEYNLRVGQVWVNLMTGVERKIIHVATAGCSDSVAWCDRDGSHGGGSAKEFVAAHTCRVMGGSEFERCGCDESKRLEAERDEAYDSARSMQLRLERVVEGSKALRARLARLEGGA